jgi:integrase/recombinase XerD
MSSPLRTRFNNYMVLRRFSPSTIKAYTKAVEGLALYYNEPPDKLTTDQVQAYLLYLIQEKKRAWSTCNVAFSAYRCFYLEILKRDKADFHLPKRPRSHELPKLLSTQEVKRLFNVIKNVKHRTLLLTIYGGGLRVSEAVNLQLHHIESSRMMIRVEQGKGRKDRYTILPAYLLQELRFYWNIYHPKRWLFPDKTGEKAMSTGTAQKIYYHAKKKAGITNGCGIHTLRHCFATHLLDQGIDIYLIKRMLGHKSLKTTITYLHTTKERISQVKSPLDLLYVSDKGTTPWDQNPLQN